MSAPGPLPRPSHGLDLTALQQPLGQPELDAFIVESKSTNKPWSRVTTGLPTPGIMEIGAQVVPVAVPMIAILFFLWVGGLDLIQAVVKFTFEARFPVNLVIVGVVALVLFGGVAGAIRVVRVIRSFGIPRAWWEAAYRITGFAAANQLRYGHDETVAYPGVIFQAGIDRTVERRLTTTSGRGVEIGNYRYLVPAEDRENNRVDGWGYVAITLDRRLPHLLLDASANNTSVFGLETSNLPVDLARDQRLSLGGEFDDRFTLYAPSDYGRDAFWIFAPDLMALFIDRLGTFDVEIVDDTMFVYGGRFDLADPQTYVWLQELVDTVVTRTVRRTERYRDDLALLEVDPGSLGASQSPGTSQPPGAQGTAPAHRNAQPVFALGGDGPTQAASNAVAERGRRLRSRRWGAWSVLGILVIGFFVYNELVAPFFGLPRLNN